MIILIFSSTLARFVKNNKALVCDQNSCLFHSIPKLKSLIPNIYNFTVSEIALGPKHFSKCVLHTPPEGTIYGQPTDVIVNYAPQIISYRHYGCTIQSTFIVLCWSVVLFTGWCWKFIPFILILLLRIL